MFFISLAAESLLKQINFFFLFHAKFNSPAAVQCPFNLSKSCVQKKPLPSRVFALMLAEALLISLLYDRDSARLEPSHKLPLHCCCSAGQLSNKPCGALLAPLHMTDATDSPWPLLSSACIDPSPPKNRFGHNNSAAR